MPNLWLKLNESLELYILLPSIFAPVEPANDKNCKNTTFVAGRAPQAETVLSKKLFFLKFFIKRNMERKIAQYELKTSTKEWYREVAGIFVLCLVAAVLPKVKALFAKFRDCRHPKNQQPIELSGKARIYCLIQQFSPTSFIVTSRLNYVTLVIVRIKCQLGIDFLFVIKFWQQSD